MSSTFAAIRTGMLGAFADKWAELRPSWTPATQTSYPPRPFSEPQSLWIKVMVTNQGGNNRAVRILDQVSSLMTVDCYSPFDADDFSSMFAVDALADDAHEALRSMTLPSGVDDVEIVPRDFPLTETGFEHKRVSLFFNFDLPRYG